MKKFGGINNGMLELYWAKVVILVLIPTICVSLISYHCIEKPFMDLGKSGPKKSTPSPA